MGKAVDVPLSKISIVYSLCCCSGKGASEARCISAYIRQSQTWSRNCHKDLRKSLREKSMEEEKNTWCKRLHPLMWFYVKKIQWKDSRWWVTGEQASLLPRNLWQIVTLSCHKASLTQRHHLTLIYIYNIYIHWFQGPRCRLQQYFILHFQSVAGVSGA